MSHFVSNLSLVSEREFIKFLWTILLCFNSISFKVSICGDFCSLVGVEHETFLSLWTSVNHMLQWGKSVSIVSVKGLWCNDGVHIFAQPHREC